MKNQEELNDLKELLDIHKERLRLLEIQRAKWGQLNVPPHILLEIKEEKDEIQRLTKEIQGCENDYQPKGGFTMIKILFLAANPIDRMQLSLDEESRAMDTALRQAEFRDRFDIKQHLALRVTDLQECLLRHKPHIVHFSGHGSKSGEIILQDNSGRSYSVPSQALSELFSVLKDNIQCVVLNACYSEPQAQAIAEHIDCVIGVSGEIGDQSAISFATAFYRALGYGRDVKTAFDLGCLEIHIEKIGEQDKPKLLDSRKRAAEIRFADRQDERLKPKLQPEKIKPVNKRLMKGILTRINLFWLEIKTVLLENKGLVLGLAGIILGLIGLGLPLPLLPFVIPAIVIFCGYKVKLLGKTKFGNVVIFLGLVFMMIRIALLAYGVTHTETQGISPVIPTNLTALKKSRICLVYFSYLILWILTFSGLIICFFKFVVSIFCMRENRVVKRWLIGVIFAGLFFYILTSEAVSGCLKKVLTDS